MNYKEPDEIVYIYDWTNFSGEHIEELKQFEKMCEKCLQKFIPPFKFLPDINEDYHGSKYHILIDEKLCYKCRIIEKIKE